MGPGQVFESVADSGPLIHLNHGNDRLLSDKFSRLVSRRIGACFHGDPVGFAVGDLDRDVRPVIVRPGRQLAGRILKHLHQIEKGFPEEGGYGPRDLLVASCQLRQLVHQPLDAKSVMLCLFGSGHLPITEEQADTETQRASMGPQITKSQIGRIESGRSREFQIRPRKRWARGRGAFIGLTTTG